MMSLPTSPQSKWKEIFERQQLANAERWLAILEQEENTASVVVAEYDNLLRALEVSLQKEQTFDLACRLIDQLFPIVVGYGDWARWLVYLEEAVALSRLLINESAEAALLSRIGEILHFKGDYQQAHDLYEQCIQIYKSLNDTENYVNVLVKSASAYEQQDNSKKGLILLEDALRVSKSIEDRKVVMSINLSLSSAYYSAREWLPGLSSAQAAYELAVELGNNRVEMRALLNIIAIQTELGNWQEVEAISQKIEDSLVEVGDLNKLSQLKNNMGIAAFSQEQFFVAEKAWQDALQINLQINQPVELARIYNNLGMVYTKLGEIDTAEDMLKLAVSIFEEMEMAYNLANTLDNLADVYESRGDIPEFQRVLFLALSLLPEDSPEPHIQSLASIINGRLAADTE
jgi:tetratricopeptide (TPR) repeat protein